MWNKSVREQSLGVIPQGVEYNAEYERIYWMEVLTPASESLIWKHFSPDFARLASWTLNKEIRIKNLEISYDITKKVKILKEMGILE